MARVLVKFTCGCGYSTERLEEAVRHSDDKRHTMTASGVIVKEIERRTRNAEEE